MRSLQGRVVFITGGSSGIGLATARLAAAGGANVVIAARDPQPLGAALTLLRSTAPAGLHRSLRCDVTSSESCREAAAEVAGTFGRCDVVIANAGQAHCLRFADGSFDDDERMMRVNHFGTVHTVRAFLPLVPEGGALGIVSSMAGLFGTFGYSAYAASKFAQVGFAQSLRHELLERRISITLLHPPDTDTPQLAAENRTKPPETAAIAGNLRPLAPEAVARAFLDGLMRRRKEVVPGRLARTVRLLHRLAPRLIDALMERDIRRVGRASQGGR